MRYKDTIKGAKKILKIAKKRPELYNEHELLYERLIKKQAQRALEHKQSKLDGNQ